jgi:NADPH:quinone reductase
VKAIEVHRNGGPEVLEFSDLASPKPKASEVLVRVAAAGVNFIDVYLREGRYPATRPFVLGQKGSGTVEEAGLMRRPSFRTRQAPTT